MGILWGDDGDWGGNGDVMRMLWGGDGEVMGML